METRADWIDAIRNLPAQLRDKVDGFTADQLTTPYNTGEWTIAQNVHHLADTHMICFRRYKLILTSPDFSFTRYDVNQIATYPDANNADIETSLMILTGLHARWTTLLENLTEDEWQKTGNFWDPNIPHYPLDRLTRVYAEHGLSHLQQIQEVIGCMDTDS